MSSQPSLVCTDEQQRRADLLAHPNSLVNGIDYIEVDPADHRLLRVFFLRPVPPANAADLNDPFDIYGLRADPTRMTITGGTRIVGIKVLDVTRQPDGHLHVTVDSAGDFSIYTLATHGVAEIDPVLGRTPFSFMAACPVDVDCPRDVVCPPTVLPEPLLDYLAKDYASFRKLLLDLLPQLNPQFIERNPSDMGIALVELLAYTGDYLSYFQDAVANEAYLETLRQRISARRHTKLVDYRMHDGRNAWTYVHIAVATANTLPQGTPLLTRITAPLLGDIAPPGRRIATSKITAETMERDPALATAVVFETTHPANFDPKNNEIFIHTWGNEECCLRPGTTEVYLYAVDPTTSLATRPVLKKGDYLLLEEVQGPLTGAAADASPAHRQVVLLDEEPDAGGGALVDPLYANTLSNGALQRFQTGLIPLPLLRVQWRRQDALGFPLCLSTRPPGKGTLRHVSVARGNIVLADHGLTTIETLNQPEPVPGDVPWRLRLGRGPLTMQCQPARVDYHASTGLLETARHELTCDVRQAVPAVSLLVTFAKSPDAELWTPVPDLLESTPFSQQFVAEVDDDGLAVLRFGDGEYGREAEGAISFQAIYRIGNGRAGNIGAESLDHIALPVAADWIQALRNPLPAQDGTDAESIEEARQRAPQAFRAEQFRAVTEDDYVLAARRLPEVAGAVASFRWTGSWYTVFVGVDPRDPADLLYEPGGSIRLAPALERRVRAFLTRYRLAGYDLEIRPPRFVPLEMAIDVCAAPGHFRTEVARAVAQALSSQTLPDGRRGFFHPDHFTFGQPVYLSQIYAAVERVEGVDSAVITRFRRYGQADNKELENGVMPINTWEIAQLENDPNFLEHGVLRITALGGKA